MTSSHDSYEDLAGQRRADAEYRLGYAEAERAFLIGRAVRERRLVLGLSQTEVARRAGMTQPALSRLEAGGVIPTIPLLERITSALDADLIVEMATEHQALGQPKHAIALLDRVEKWLGRIEAHEADLLVQPLAAQGVEQP